MSTNDAGLRAKKPSVALSPEVHARLLVAAYSGERNGDDVRDAMSKMAEAAIVRYLDNLENGER